MRYVVADLEEVGAELARLASEVDGWLEGAAGPAGPAGGSAAGRSAAETVAERSAAGAVAEVDIACYQALSATAHRLRTAASALAACASDMRDTDRGIAQRLSEEAYR